MKERNLFAALAMQELLRWELKEKGSEKKVNITSLTKNAFLLADAMVELGKEKLPADIENIA